MGSKLEKRAKPPSKAKWSLDIQMNRSGVEPGQRTW
jgi:hypothetical protein